MSCIKQDTLTLFFFHRIMNEKINQNNRCLYFYEFLPYIPEKLEDTKGVISSRYLKKDTQYNGQRKKTEKQTNDLQNTTHKTKDRATRTPHKSRDGLKCSGRVSISCSTSNTRQLPLLQTR